MKLKQITIDRLEYLVRTKLHEKRHIEMDPDFIIKNLKDQTDYINYKNKISYVNLDLKELGLDIIGEYNIKHGYTKSKAQHIYDKINQDITSLDSVIFYIIESSNSIDEVYDKIQKHYNITMERPCIK